MTTADETPLCPIPHLLREPEPSSPGLSVAAAADDPGLLAVAPSATARALARGQREKRPGRRPSANHGLELGGHSVHIGVSFRPDGTVLEFFVDLHKEGAPLRMAAHVVSTLGSMSLQRGVSLRDVCSGLRTTFSEPSGAVVGHEPEHGEPITSALSLFDLVAQVLEREDAALRQELAMGQAKKEVAR